MSFSVVIKISSPGTKSCMKLWLNDISERFKDCEAKSTTFAVSLGPQVTLSDLKLAIK